MTRDEMTTLRDEVIAVFAAEDETNEDKLETLRELFADCLYVLAEQEADAQEEEAAATPARLLFTALTDHGRVTDARNLARTEQDRLLQDLWSVARYAS